MSKQAQMNFEGLVTAIQQVHEHMAAQAGKAVNISLTLRNWITGWYIREYEQNGADRAQYGEQLLSSLSRRLGDADVAGFAARSLRLYRQFYLAYPEIWQSATAKSPKGPLPKTIWPTLSAKFGNSAPTAILQSLDSESAATAAPSIRGTVSPELHIPMERLITSLSFSHFVELIPIEDRFKRTFYEVECVRGNWSVRELTRQIATLYFERSGLSRNKKKLSAMVQSGAEEAEPKLAIRDPYIFEFLGLKSKEVMSESDLEDGLLDKLQDFLLELGDGFCFEARQKRILIGKTHGFVDLVFYHRILKCHVLVELKVDEFTHEHIGQLNTYVTWYRKNMMIKGDNPPVGLLLCTQKDHALVEYALAGMDNSLFVSKYQLELPKKDDIQRFLEEQMQEGLVPGSQVKERRTR